MKRRVVGACIFCGVRHTAATATCKPDMLNAAHRKALREEQDELESEAEDKRTVFDRLTDGFDMVRDDEGEPEWWEYW